jgi:SSS family solute:Na+ symporter
MRALDIAVLLIYVVGVTAFGAWFYRRARTPEGFTSADGRMPSWAVGLSIFGTYLSSISFLALPGKSYTGNWNAFVFSLSLPLAAWAASRWFAPLYRASGDISAYAYLERRFGVWARLYAMVFYLLTQIARMGTIMFLVALALQRLTGWGLVPVIIASGALVTFYTLLGGIEAVIWTDVVQSLVLTGGALVCAGLLLFDVPGGPGQLIAHADASAKFSLGSLSVDFTHSTVWVVLLYGIVINLQNFGIDQSYIQRYQTARSPQAARRSIWIGALMYIPVSALFLFIGTALFSYYGLQPNLLPSALHAPAMSDRVFPYFMTTALPPGMTGLMIAALSAAAMSSIDTSINSSATVLLSDVYRRFVAPDADHVRQMRFLHLTTLVLGVLGTGTALLMISIQHALDAWWRISGIFSGGMLGLFLLGAFSRRTRATQAGAGMVVGLLVILWASFSRGIDAPWANGLDALMTAVIGTTAIFVVGTVLSRGKERRQRATPAETVYDLPRD